MSEQHQITITMKTDYDFISELESQKMTPQEGCLAGAAVIALFIIIVIVVALIELFRH